MTNITNYDELIESLKKDESLVKQLEDCIEEEFVSDNGSNIIRSIHFDSNDQSFRVLQFKNDHEWSRSDNLICIPGWVL